MTTIDELEQRVRLLELDSRSEKQVSQQTLEQLVAIATAVNLLRLEVSQGQTTHGSQIARLQQDVTVIRNETVGLRRGEEEIHARLDTLERRMDARFDAVLEAIRAIGPRSE